MTMAMDRFLFRPLSAAQLILIALLLTAMTTAYCMAYTAFAGQMESPLEGIVWTALNILPWLLCLEFAKRQSGWPLKLATIAGFLIGMALLDAATGAGDIPWLAAIGFEMTRRVPAALLVTGLLVFAEFLRRYGRATGTPAARRPTTELPLLPSQIEWVRAAGNYVELHGGGTTILHRAPISAVERALSGQGFVRIHRSVLVNRSAICRIAAGDVRLHCGQSLPIGNRYRSGLMDLSPAPEN